MDFSNFKKSFSGISRNFSDFWESYFRIFFALFSIVILLVSVYFWYQSIFQSEWSLEKKNQYKNSQNKSVELKQKQFNEILAEIDKKKADYDGSIEFTKDIFLPYEGSAIEEQTNSSNNDSKSSTKPSQTQNTKQAPTPTF